MGKKMMKHPVYKQQGAQASKQIKLIYGKKNPKVMVL